MSRTLTYVKERQCQIVVVWVLQLRTHSTHTLYSYKAPVQGLCVPLVLTQYSHAAHHRGHITSGQSGQLCGQRQSRLGCAPAQVVQPLLRWSNYWLGDYLLKWSNHYRCSGGPTISWAIICWGGPTIGWAIICWGGQVVGCLNHLAGWLLFWVVGWYAICFCGQILIWGNYSSVGKFVLGQSPE